MFLATFQLRHHQPNLHAAWQDQDNTPNTSQRGVNGRLGLQVMPAATTTYISRIQPANNQLQLTTSAADDVDPAWSPDGAKIVFISNRDGNFEIYVMNADGSKPDAVNKYCGR